MHIFCYLVHYTEQGGLQRGAAAMPQGAGVSANTGIYNLYLSVLIRSGSTPGNPARRTTGQGDLYKILCHFKALLWDSIIFVCSPPPAKPTLLQY